MHFIGWLALVFCLTLFSSPGLAQDTDDTSQQSEQTTETAQESESDETSDEQATAPVQAETWQAPETFEPLQKEFADLARRFAESGVQPTSPDIRTLRDKVTRFNTEREPTETSLAIELQLLYWGNERGAPMRDLVDRLTAIGPQDAGLRIALAGELETLDRIDDALTVLDAGPIDLAQHPSAAIVRARALVRENRFDDAEQALQSIPPGAKISPEQLDEIYRLRTDTIDRYRDDWQRELTLRQAEAAADDLPRVEIITSKGAFTVELFENQAPNTVANFISVVESGFYNGLKFHQVNPLYAAAGNPQTRTLATPEVAPPPLDYTIRDELPEGEYRKHFAGVVSMEKRGPDSAASEFIITRQQMPRRDGINTVFGRVIDGMRVVRNLEPDDDLLTARVLRKRGHVYEPEKIPVPTPEQPGESETAPDDDDTAAPGQPAGEAGDHDDDDVGDDESNQ